MLGKHFRVLEEIGRGGQGIVLKAECVEAIDCVGVGDVVAVKILQFAGEDATTHAVFNSRARALCRLDHKNIVDYLTHFVHRTAFTESRCLVLEYLVGKTLQDWLAERKDGLPWKEVSRIVTAVLEALGHATSQGLTHRDIKPSNIFITDDGSVKLLDFDIATERDGSKTITSGWRGAFDYRAPDYVRISRFSGDEISDVFSVGVCLYEALCGCLPFPSLADDGADFAYMQRWREGEQLPTVDHTKGPLKILTPNVRDVIDRSLNDNRELRYQTFETMRKPLVDIGFYVVRGAEARYELRRFIAKGGFGEIFEAVEQGTSRRVAVKRLFASAQNRRFVKEARVLARQEHPHIVKYVEFVEQKVGPGQTERYLVMELLPGMPGASLWNRIRSSRGGLPVEEIVVLFDGYLNALQHLHEQDIIHRDIKPGNLYAPAGEPCKGCILDLGIARDARATLSMSGNVPGTLDYMAPEFGLRGRSERGSPRTDLYALGLCMYEALVGQSPFPRLPPEPTAAYKAFAQRCASRKDGDIPFSHPVFDQYPQLKPILERLLERKPGRRFLSAAHVRRALREPTHPEAVALPALPREEAETQATVFPEAGLQDGAITVFDTVQTLLGDESEINDGIRRSVKTRRVQLASRGVGTVCAIASLTAATWLFTTLIPERYAAYKQRRAVARTRNELDSAEFLPGKFVQAANELSDVRAAALKWRGRRSAGSGGMLWNEVLGSASSEGAGIPDRLLAIVEDALRRGRLDRLREIQEEWRQLKPYCAAMGITGNRHNYIAARFIEAGIPREFTPTNIGIACAARDAAATLPSPTDSQNGKKMQQILDEIGHSISNRTIRLIERLHARACDTHELLAHRETALENLRGLRGPSGLLGVLTAYTNKLADATKALEDPAVSDEVKSALEEHGRDLQKPVSAPTQWRHLRDSIKLAFGKLQHYQSGFGDTTAWQQLATNAVNALNVLVRQVHPVEQREARLKAAEILLGQARDAMVIETAASDEMGAAIAEERDVCAVEVTNLSGQTLAIVFEKNSLESAERPSLAKGEGSVYRLRQEGRDLLRYTPSDPKYQPGERDVTCVLGSGVRVAITNLIFKPVTVKVIGHLTDLDPPVEVKFREAESTGTWTRCGRSTNLVPGSYTFRFSRPDYAVEDLTAKIEPGHDLRPIHAPEDGDWEPTPALVLLQRLRGWRTNKQEAVQLLPQDSPRFEYNVHEIEYDQCVEGIRGTEQHRLGPIAQDNNRSIKALLEWCYQYDLLQGRSRCACSVPPETTISPLPLQEGSEYSAEARRFAGYAESRHLFGAEHTRPQQALHPELAKLCDQLKSIADSSDGELRSKCVAERAILLHRIGAPAPEDSSLPRTDYPELGRFDVHDAYRQSKVRTPMNGYERYGENSNQAYVLLNKFATITNIEFNEYDLLLAFDLATECSWSWFVGQRRDPSSPVGREAQNLAANSLGILNKMLKSVSSKTKSELRKKMGDRDFRKKLLDRPIEDAGEPYRKVLTEEAGKFELEELQEFLDPLS